MSTTIYEDILSSLRDLHPDRNPIECDNVMEAKRILASTKPDSSINRIKIRLARKTLKEEAARVARKTRPVVRGCYHYMRKRKHWKDYDQKYHMVYLFKLFRLRCARRKQVCMIPFVVFANLKLEEKRRGTKFNIICKETEVRFDNSFITTCNSTVVPVPLSSVFDELTTIIPEDEFPRPKKRKATPLSTDMCN